MAIEQEVIDNIRKIRKKKGITQEQLAEACNTSVSYIGLMETYKNIPKLSTIEKIAKVLNVPVQTLFFNEDQIKLSQISPELKENLKKELIEIFSEKIDELLNQF